MPQAAGGVHRPAFRGEFGIYATGKKDEVQVEDECRMGTSAEEERQARQDILAHFEHIKALGYKPKESPGPTDP